MKLPKGIHRKKKTGGFEAYVHHEGRKRYAGYSDTLPGILDKLNRKRASLGLSPVVYFENNGVDDESI